jgi:uncharacterized protein YcbX
MLRINQLFIYPIKSLAGIEINEGTLTDRGFEHDRRWMLVDENNRFLTQREFGQMALLQPSLGENGLLITHKKTGDQIRLPFTPETDELFPAIVWDDTCPVIRVSDTADEWFSKQLGSSCKLVFMPDHSTREVDHNYASKGEVTNLGDGYPLLIIGQASLDDLNGRLEQPLSIKRFRPNIVFTGGDPYQEDEMSHFRIGQIDFYGAKPCARCPIPTIDLQTGERGKEPLRTLSTYRRRAHKVYFGQNLLYDGSGSLRVGDELQVMEMAATAFGFD